MNGHIDTPKAKKPKFAKLSLKAIRSHQKKNPTITTPWNEKRITPKSSPEKGEPLGTWEGQTTTTDTGHAIEGGCILIMAAVANLMKIVIRPSTSSESKFYITFPRATCPTN